MAWRLHGGSAALPATAAGFFGVGSSAVGPYRPSLHLLVVRALLASKGRPALSCGPLLVSRLVPQDRARLAPNGKTELGSRPVLQDAAMVASFVRVSALGAAEGCERLGLSARLFGWGSDGSRVRRCLGLGCRGGGRGGGSTVLVGRGCGLVLPGGHSRVGGVVAGVWRSVVGNFDPLVGQWQRSGVVSFLKAPSWSPWFVENEVRILKALKYVGAKRGIVHQGFLDEYDIDQARQEEIHIMSQVKEGTQSLCIGSVLIATVTFGATFTMPGGLRDDDETNAGSPILAGTFHFYAFIVANTLAFTLSVMATISFIFSGDPMVHLRTRKVLFIRAIPLLLISVSSMVVAFALGTYMMLAPIAPVSALAIFLILILILVYYSWGMTISRIVLFTALCKRKGKWYGIVWAWPCAFLLVVLILSSLLLLAFKLAQVSHTGGKVEPPAQPPTPFA
ncbi:hypothetical protein CFC21_085564 [Triticum aestivum]|uniref:PGG domain-containing protein n=2 Tax=Triticum aestivum TaxID=4565 RepID=A0A9R1IDR2_WHEAT|nr:hypothetical protein CFC21_085564 [Triticum aestivum]